MQTNSPLEARRERAGPSGENKAGSRRLGVDKFLELLSSLVPAWIAFLAIAFGYLVYLFRRASKEFISLSEKQSEYLKDRVEVVDKATTIFTRTIGQQEKEIAKLTTRLKKLDSHIDESRSIATEKAIEEIKTLQGTVRNITKMQEIVLEIVSRSKLLVKDSVMQSHISQIRAQIETNLEEDIPRAIRSRDLSLYPVKTANCKGARELVRKLKAKGFTASIYLGITGEDEEEQDLIDEASPQEEHHAIWVGDRVPTKVAVQIISIAVEHWPFLRYVHISTDSDQGPPESVHSLMFLGGSTETATARYRLVPWTAENFRQLRENMSQSEFHAYIHRFYPQLASPLP